MASRPLSAFRSLKTSHPQYSCFIENTDYTITCTVCNKWIQVKKKSHLDSHLKSAFHCTMISLGKPLQEMAANIETIKHNTERLLSRSATKSNSKTFDKLLDFSSVTSQSIAQLPASEIESKISRSHSRVSSKSGSRNRLWYDEVRAAFKGKATESEYIRYNNNF